MTGGPGGHVSPKLSGPESCRAHYLNKNDHRLEKNEEKLKKKPICFTTRALRWFAFNNFTFYHGFLGKKNLKKALKQGDVWSGPKFCRAHIYLCPSNSDVIKYAPAYCRTSDLLSQRTHTNERN